MTAEELLNKLKDDKKYQKKISEKESELRKKHDELVQESKMFSEDCKHFGYNLQTPWDLINISEPYPKLIPILVKYLEQNNYSSKFREGVARALAVKDASDYFDNILCQYNNASVVSENLKWAIACALSGAATLQKHFDVIKQLIFDRRNGNSRNALLDTVKLMNIEQKKEILEYVKTDVQLLPNLKMNGY